MSDKKDLTDPTFCPHCNQKMERWQAADLNAWGDVTQWVCFNDECSYYVGGWKWMEEKYGTNTSYRHRYNPDTGEKGPLPVYSPTAGRTGIVHTEEESDDQKEKPE